MAFELSTLAAIEETAVERVRYYCRNKPVVLAFSYGKDSCVVKHIMDLSGVPYVARYRPATIHPPDLLRWGRKAYPGVVWERPKQSMWDVVVRKGTPPTRHNRYCCEEMKEGASCPGGVVVMGIRWAESQRRKATRRMAEPCAKRNELLLNPIIDWSNDQLWRYIHWRNIPVSPLYQEGFDRLGCVGCPNANWKSRVKELERWPHIRDGWKKAFGRMLKAHPTRKEGGVEWKTAEDVYRWWLYEESRPKADGPLVRLWSKFDDDGCDYGATAEVQDANS